MPEDSSSTCIVSGREYKISTSFNCDSSGVVKLLCCNVCGKQKVVVGRTFMQFKIRLNKYKSSCRTFSSGIPVTQAEIFRHSTVTNRHQFKDISFQFYAWRSKRKICRYIVILSCVLYHTTFYKTKNSLKPSFINEPFKPRDLQYNLRNKNTLDKPKVRTTS